jgi:hypothetical protein
MRGALLVLVVLFSVPAVSGAGGVLPDGRRAPGWRGRFEQTVSAASNALKRAASATALSFQLHWRDPDLRRLRGSPEPTMVRKIVARRYWNRQMQLMRRYTAPQRRKGTLRLTYRPLRSRKYTRLYGREIHPVAPSETPLQQAGLEVSRGEPRVFLMPDEFWRFVLLRIGPLSPRLRNGEPLPMENWGVLAVHYLLPQVENLSDAFFLAGAKYQAYIDKGPSERPETLAYLRAGGVGTLQMNQPGFELDYKVHGLNFLEGTAREQLGQLGNLLVLDSNGRWIERASSSPSLQPRRRRIAAVQQSTKGGEVKPAFPAVYVGREWAKQTYEAPAIGLANVRALLQILTELAAPPVGDPYVPGRNLLVRGYGPNGAATARMLRKLGIFDVRVYDISEEARARAEKDGFFVFGEEEEAVRFADIEASCTGAVRPVVTDDNLAGRRDGSLLVNFASPGEFDLRESVASVIPIRGGADLPGDARAGSAPGDSARDSAPDARDATKRPLRRRRSRWRRMFPQPARERIGLVAEVRGRRVYLGRPDAPSHKRHAPVILPLENGSEGRLIMVASGAVATFWPKVPLEWPLIRLTMMQMFGAAIRMVRYVNTTDPARWQPGWQPPDWSDQFEAVLRATRAYGPRFTDPPLGVSASRLVELWRDADAGDRNTPGGR